MKKHTCTYLFADGHAVVCFEKEDKDAGTVRFCEVFERFVRPEAVRFTGRLIFGRYGSEALIDLCRRATRIEAEAPEVAQKLGLAVGTLTLELPAGRLYWHDFPGLISGPYTYQPGESYAEKFDPEAVLWADCRIAKMHRVAAATVA